MLPPLATVAVHQLRYALAYGTHASRALTEQGDGYVSALVPGMIVLALLGLGGLVLVLARALRDARAARPWPRPRLPLACGGAAALLLAGYLTQESLEVLVGESDRSLLPLAFGGGGWIGVPLCLAFRLVWGIVARWASESVARARRRHSSEGLRTAPAPLILTAETRKFCRVVSPLAQRRAGRAPPLALSPR
jgi:hypothetical protein